MRKLFWFIAFIALLIPFSSAAHYITGYVGNARDGEPANDKTILIWHYENLADNLLDIVGPSGNSGADNVYMIDCEMLSLPCNVGDILSVQIIDNGNGYISEIKNVTVSGYGYTLVSDIILNTPPTASLNYPDGNNFSNSAVNINCSAADLDSNLASITLYGNWSGWHANETKAVSGGQASVVFTKTLPDGTYKYACKATDNLSSSSFSANNYTFLVDTLKPVISSVIINTSYSCGVSERVRVTCSASDDRSGIDKVIIRAISPTKSTNYTTFEFPSGSYFSDIPIDEIGSWKFKCIANDTAGNYQENDSVNITSYSSMADLELSSDAIRILDNKLIEGKNAIINITLNNIGCASANGFKLNFLDEGKSIYNKTMSLGERTSVNTSFNWSAKVGNTNLTFIADYDNFIGEFNESNNNADKIVYVTPWQDFYGNLNVDKILGKDDLNITLWLNQDNVTGNIFIVNQQSYINWFSLHAIGRKTDGSVSSEDFSTIDSLLGMSELNDSIVNKFTYNSAPVNTTTVMVHQKEIYNVPVVNSSESNNFMTGILWDSTKDHNGYFDADEKEDLVFVSPVNSKSEGAYGTYDYEITVPALLRDYYEESNELYFYYELN